MTETKQAGIAEDRTADPAWHTEAARAMKIVSLMCATKRALVQRGELFDGVKNGLEVDVDCSGKCSQLWS